MKWLFWWGGLLLLSAACTHLSPTATTMAPSTEIQPLARWFNLTILPQPVQAQWVQRQRGIGGSAPGPTDFYVVAVLTYDWVAPDLATYLQLQPRDTVYAEAQLLESWMPAVIRSHFTVTPEGYLRFDGPAYKAEGVLKSPLSYGYILIVENYIFIYGATR